MVLGTFNIIHSSDISNTQDYSIHYNYRNFHINIPINKTFSNTLSIGPLFKNINCLTIEFDSSMLTFWQNIRDLCN